MRAVTGLLGVSTCTADVQYAVILPESHIMTDAGLADL